MLNARLDGEALDRHCTLSAPATRFLQTTASRLGWSARAYHRVLRVARSAADLAGSVAIDVPHLAEAIQFRRALLAADQAGAGRIAPASS